jgi:hypothetical protein
MNPILYRSKCLSLFTKGKSKSMVNITQFHCIESEKFDNHPLFDVHAQWNSERRRVSEEALHITPPFLSNLNGFSNWLPYKHKYRISDEESVGRQEVICLKCPGDTVSLICDNVGVYLGLRKKWERGVMWSAPSTDILVLNCIFDSSRHDLNMRLFIYNCDLFMIFIIFTCHDQKGVKLQSYGISCRSGRVQKSSRYLAIFACYEDSGLWP